MLYNPNNHFLNDNNYYANTATFNTLAIPKEKEFLITKSLWVNEIIDEYTKPQSALIYWKNLNGTPSPTWTDMNRSSTDFESVAFGCKSLI